MNQWLNYKGLKCIILCAGEGTRLIPTTLKKPKVMIQIGNRPILEYVINYWRKYTNDFVFIVKFKKEEVIEFVNQLPINCQFVEQKELKGIADAILYAKDLVLDRFIVVLGDCICRGDFNFPLHMEQGIGVWKTQDMGTIRQSYSLEIRHGFVSHVKEKPKKVYNDLCGMGFYFFSKKVFDYIALTEPSYLRGEIEITDTIQKMIDHGEKISPVFFEGNYLNITYPEDLIRAEKSLFS